MREIMALESWWKNFEKILKMMFGFVSMASESYCTLHSFWPQLTLVDPSKALLNDYTLENFSNWGKAGSKIGSFGQKSDFGIKLVHTVYSVGSEIPGLRAIEMWAGQFLMHICFHTWIWTYLVDFVWQSLVEIIILENWFI